MNYEEESLDPVVVTKSCVTGDFTIMMASIAYTTLLLLISSLLGWNCRNLPANYRVNELKKYFDYFDEHYKG